MDLSPGLSSNCARCGPCGSSSPVCAIRTVRQAAHRHRSRGPPPFASRRPPWPPASSTPPRRGR
eukprot:402498-Heterocapsa_arctica.AAC.1